MSEFEGRVAVVTGAASGIGAATATLLSARGARVVGFDINGDPARDITTVDVTDEVAVTAAYEAVVAAHGTVHVLVNCAGVGGQATISDLDLAEYDRVMDVNARAAVVLSKLVLPAMIVFCTNV